MNKERVSEKQGISLIFLFIIGSSTIYAQGLEAKKDLWLAFILGILMVLPLSIIYARIHYLFPEKNLFDVLEICFGKFIGKILILLFVSYVFFVTGDIFITFGQFITDVNFPETPQMISILFLGLLCIWGVNNGIELLGRFSKLFVFIPITSLIITIFFLIPKMNINNLRPMLEEGIKPVLEGTFSVFTFPLVQIVLFPMVFSSFKKGASSYKIYVTGLLTGGTFLALLSITNILVLGVETATSTFYPIHAAISRISVFDIIERIEVVITTTFIIGGFIKLSILLLSICKGVAKVLNFKDYRFIIVPLLLLILNLSYFQYETVIYYFNFGRKIWPYYTFPFQTILPIIIWIAAEIKTKKHRVLK